jgi:hypothetical protein
MITTNTIGPIQQQARQWAEQLGSLAAERPPASPQGPVQPLGLEPSPDGLSALLPATISRLLERLRDREQTARNLRAQEFLVGA